MITMDIPVKMIVMILIVKLILDKIVISPPRVNMIDLIITVMGTKRGNGQKFQVVAMKKAGRTLSLIVVERNTGATVPAVTSLGFVMESIEPRNVGNSTGWWKYD